MKGFWIDHTDRYGDFLGKLGGSAFVGGIGFLPEFVGRKSTSNFSLYYQGIIGQPGQY